MKGRAGRKGYDSIGESFLLCTAKKDESKVKALVNKSLDPVNSCYTELLIARALLEIIYNKLVVSYDDVLRYMGCSLFGTQSNIRKGTANIRESNEAIQYLLKNEMITLDGDDESGSIASQHYLSTLYYSLQYELIIDSEMLLLLLHSNLKKGCL